MKKKCMLLFFFIREFSDFSFPLTYRNHCFSQVHHGNMIFLILAASLALLAYILWLKNREALRLPPGPYGIPLLGYLPWIDAKFPHITLTNLAKKYGPIYGLRMGSLYTVVLTDPRLVKQAFAKDAFAGRAPLYLTHGMMQGYGKYILSLRKYRFDIYLSLSSSLSLSSPIK